jgi:hypothetical protein
MYIYVCSITHLRFQKQTFKKVPQSAVLKSSLDPPLMSAAGEMRGRPRRNKRSMGRSV